MGHICEAITIESVLIYSLSIFPQFRHNVYYRKGYYYLNNNKVYISIDVGRNQTVCKSITRMF